MVAGIDSLLLQPVIIFDSFERVGKYCVCLINRLQYAFLFSLLKALSLYWCKRKLYASLIRAMLASSST